MGNHKESQTNKEGINPIKVSDIINRDTVIDESKEIKTAIIYYHEDKPPINIKCDDSNLNEIGDYILTLKSKVVAIVRDPFLILYK